MAQGLESIITTSERARRTPTRARKRVKASAFVPLGAGVERELEEPFVAGDQFEVRLFAAALGAVERHRDAAEVSMRYAVVAARIDHAVNRVIAVADAVALTGREEILGEVVLRIEVDEADRALVGEVSGREQDWPPTPFCRRRP